MRVTGVLLVLAGAITIGVVAQRALNRANKRVPAEDPVPLKPVPVLHRAIDDDDDDTDSDDAQLLKH